MQQGSTAAGKCVCIRNDEVRVLDAGAMYFRRRVVIFFCWPPLMIRSDFFLQGRKFCCTRKTSTAQFIWQFTL